MYWWWRVNGGAWYGGESGTADPETWTNGIPCQSLETATMQAYVGGGILSAPTPAHYGDAVLSVNSGGSAYTYAPPSGFGGPGGPNLDATYSLIVDPWNAAGGNTFTAATPTYLEYSISSWEATDHSPLNNATLSFYPATPLSLYPNFIGLFVSPIAIVVGSSYWASEAIVVGITVESYGPVNSTGLPYFSGTVMAGDVIDIAIAPATPAAPILVLDGTTESTVTVNWTQPSGPPVSQYGLVYKVHGTGTWSSPVYGATSPYEITGLTEGQGYDVQVWAYANGISSYVVSNIVTGYTISPVATVADLFFSPVPSFVDFTVQANRRLFVSNTGGAQDIGANPPFSAPPPVLLSRNGTPASFAANQGRGGPFNVSGGSLSAGASNPPGSAYNVVTVESPASANGVLGDYLTGNLYSFNPKAYTDNGTAKRWLRRWRALPGGSPEAKRFSALNIDMIQVGTQVPPAANPQVMLRWSDDGGHSWSDWRIQPVGQLGQTAANVKFNRLGSTRRFGPSDRIFELSSADPFSVAIADADVDVS